MHDPQTEVNIEGYYESTCTECGAFFAGMVEGTAFPSTNSATILFECEECGERNERSVANPPVERPFI